MTRQPDQADLWLAEHDPLYDMAREAQANSEDALSLSMKNHSLEGYVILEEEREEVANTLKN